MNLETPMRLTTAVEVLRGEPGFPADLSMSMLKTEIRKGRLTPASVAGKFYVTPAQIRDLFQPCPAEPKARASTSSNVKAEMPSGSSVTEPMSGAQAALQDALATLRRPSNATSRTSGRTARPKSGTVVTLHKSA
jgi:hypothetical protein